MPPGPLPKAASARQRRNKRSTHAVLHSPEPGEVDIPGLPVREGGWHKLTKAWWCDVWRSPMGPEYDESDLHGLWVLAAIVDDFWTATTRTERQAASSEMRLQAQRFGISPLDRRRLEWEIERSEEARDRGRKRRAQTPQAPAEPPKPAGRGVDPRDILRVV